jgi:hypothetical protein
MTNPRVFLLCWSGLRTRRLRTDLFIDIFIVVHMFHVLCLGSLPGVDMKLVKTLPPMPSGRTDMTLHYAACHHASKYITSQITAESDSERALHEQQVA